MSDRHDELERLRRAAFARGAGDAEVAAYRAALERQAAAESGGAHDPAAAPDPGVAPDPTRASGSVTAPQPGGAPESAAALPDEPATLPDEPAPGSAAPAARAARDTIPIRRLTALAAGGLALLLAGAAIGWWLGGTRTGGPAAAASDVFDHWEDLPAASRPFEDDSIRDADTRLLGGLEGLTFVGTIGIGTEGFLDGQSVVCLGVVFDDESGAGACTTRDGFERDGVWVGSSGPNGNFTFVWDADGPPAAVPCPPENWLRTCPARIG